MILKNREELEDYNIPEDWYKNHKKGISAMVRVRDEEQWIGPCLESILPFFDEIVVVINNSKDRSKEIVNAFKSDKIKVYDYPFDLNYGHPNYSETPEDSLHEKSYHLNWCMSITSCTHVSRWDADMIMLPNLYNKSFYNMILEKNIVRVKGYQVVAPDFRYLSKTAPFTGYEIRFFKVNKKFYYVKGQTTHRETYLGLPELLNPKSWVTRSESVLQRIYNLITNNDIYIKEPGYIHTKFIKKHYQWRKRFPENWRKIERFRKVDRRKEKGRRVDLTPPDCVLKKPEDYLEGGEE